MTSHDHNHQNQMSSVIAIDGPSGSGKSTLAKLVAKKLNIVYIDTGAMFRSLGLYLTAEKINIATPTDEDLEKISQSLSKINFNYAPSADVLVEINGIDYTQKIREHHVSLLASQVSKIILIRSYLKNLQRIIAGANHCVMEGRDIGTVVFPNAYCKIFLTASNEVRATRRFDELKAKGDTISTYEVILKDIIERDLSDINRENAPLKKADDAVVVDTSKLTIEQVTDEIIKISKSKINLLGFKR